MILHKRFFAISRIHLAIVLASAAMIQGCAGGRRDSLPPQVGKQVARLTSILTGEGDRLKYDAALELGEIGLKYDLPGETISVLAAVASLKPGPALEFGEIGLKYDLPEETIAALKAVAATKPDTADDSAAFELWDMVWGSGSVCIHGYEGACIAFWMWEIQEMRSEAERLAFLWSKFCDPDNGDGVRIFCVDQFAEIESDAVIPYLAAAAASATGHHGDWYVRGRAVERLCLFLSLPQTEGFIHLLTGSWDENVADAAKEALKEYKIGPPSD